MTDAEAHGAGGSKGELDITDHERGEIIVGFYVGTACSVVSSREPVACSSLMRSGFMDAHIYTRTTFTGSSLGSFPFMLQSNSYIEVARRMKSE